MRRSCTRFLGALLVLVGLGAGVAAPASAAPRAHTTPTTGSATTAAPASGMRPADWWW